MSSGFTWSRSSDEKTTRPLSSPENSFIPLVLHVKDVMEPLWRPTTSKRRNYRHRKRTFDLTAANFVSPHISTEFLTCLFRPGSGDTNWKTATRPDAVPTATRSSKQLSSFTAVMASLLPWKHTRVTTGFETVGWWLSDSLFFTVYLMKRVIVCFTHAQWKIQDKVMRENFSRIFIHFPFQS